MKDMIDSLSFQVMLELRGPRVLVGTKSCIREGASENRREDGGCHVSAQKPMAFLADTAKFQMQIAKSKFNRRCLWAFNI